MTSPSPQETPQPEVISPDSIVRLRDDPPRVMRLSRKVIASVAGTIGTLVAGAAIYAMLPEHETRPKELYKTGSVAVPEAVVRAPGDYGAAPKLGPPLPGDLGKPLLEASQKPQPTDQLRPTGPTLPAPAYPYPIRPAAPVEAGQQQREAARASQLFFPNQLQAQPQTERTAAAPGDFASAPSAASRATESDANQTIARPRGTRVIQAGTVIAAALITGIRSDIPGLVTAQVTENVYDSPTGQKLLIPQGARLIGEYASETSFGQNRVQLLWTRLIFPDGRSHDLGRLPAADASGYAGLKDKTDYHWAGVFRAAMISTLLGAGAEFGAGNDNNLERALRRGTQDSINRAGEQIVSRELNIRPSLAIRPGFPVRVMVTRDIFLDESR